MDPTDDTFTTGRHTDLVVNDRALEPLDFFAMARPSGRSLADLEGVIERGKLAFVEVGIALAEIRNQQLYNEQFATFESYCQQRWGWGKRHADRHIAAAEVVASLRPIGLKPTNESQARELGRIKDVVVRNEVWNAVAEEHGVEGATSRVIREYSVAVTPTPEPERVHTQQWAKRMHELGMVVKEVRGASMKGFATLPTELQQRFYREVQEARSALEEAEGAIEEVSPSTKRGKG